MTLGKPNHHNVVIGQHVSPGKLQIAHGLRRRMTPEEKQLWYWLRDSRLGVHFRRQQVIDGFIADFYCHQALLVVEADSRSHDPEYDAERDRIFAKHHILVLRFKNNQIMSDMPYVLNQIRFILRQRLKDSSSQ